MTTTQLSTALRPQRLQDVVGQPGAVAYVRGMIKDGATPSLVVITGPFGTGKTTLARIIAHYLTGHRGDPERDPDVREASANVDRTIEDVRELLKYVEFLPRGGRRRVVIVDEAHSYAGLAAGAMLKATEDPPKHVTWIWCTSEAHKLQPALKQRGQFIVLKSLTDDDVGTVVRNALASQGVRLREETERRVVGDIVRASFGSPRQAVQIVESLVRTLHGGGSIRDSLEQAVETVLAVDGMEAALAFVEAALAGDVKGGVRALAGSDGSGVVEISLGLVNGLMRIAAGGQPRDGLGWMAKKIRTRASLDDLQALLKQLCTVQNVRVASNYSIPADALLMSVVQASPRRG